MYEFLLQRSRGFFEEDDDACDARLITFDTTFSYSCCPRPESEASGKKKRD